MTDEGMIDASNRRAEVTVKANDYSYDGWVVGIIQKMRGQLRCAVEDINGRLFIHNASQLTEKD